MEDWRLTGDIARQFAARHLGENPTGWVRRTELRARWDRFLTYELEYKEEAKNRPGIHILYKAIREDHPAAKAGEQTTGSRAGFPGLMLLPETTDGPPRTADTTTGTADGPQPAPATAAEMF